MVAIYEAHNDVAKQRTGYMDRVHHNDMKPTCIVAMQGHEAPENRDRVRPAESTASNAVKNSSTQGTPHHDRMVEIRTADPWFRLTRSRDRMDAVG